MPRRQRRHQLLLGSVVLLALAVVAPTAVAAPPRAFQHVGTFDVTTNGSEVAEVVAAYARGQGLVYTDAGAGAVGLVDISDPTDPQPAGTVPMPGEPTSVAVRNRHALVAVNTSASFTDPSGELVVVDLVDAAIDRTYPLPGQPDSVAISPDGRYVAIAIENERDEDLDDGLLPQLPGGSLVVADLRRGVGDLRLREVDLSGLADVAPTDPEPEYVAINRRQQVVVTMQENNHVAVVDLWDGDVSSDFSAGEVTLEGVDATEEEIGPQEAGLIEPVETITRRREPDSVAWVGDWWVLTANEGDYEDADGVEGGSRGWTLFNRDGDVLADAGTSFEYAGIRAGHYAEGRSANKGSEPEAAAAARYWGDWYGFVGSERANYVQVLDVSTATPRPLQLLPTGIGPEGLATIPSRSLLAVANETGEGGVPSMITLYRLQRGEPSYPQIASVDVDGVPVPWVALSGLAGDRADADRAWAVSDSFLAEGYVYEVDLATSPPSILGRRAVTGASSTLDLEGIVPAPDGGFWLASEGRADARPNALLEVDADLAVEAEFTLPEELLADGSTNSGFEGVALLEGASAGVRYVYAVVQREWDSDPEGVVKIARLDPSTGEWAFVGYPLDPPSDDGWVGLSELTALQDGTYAVVERDNLLGPSAATKKVYGVDLAAAPFQPYVSGEPLPVVGKTLLADLLDELEANSVWTPDKLEGLAVTADGDVWAVTDNDGLDEALGQTLMLDLGPVASALAGD